jgi:hypothetical protein
MTAIAAATPEAKAADCATLEKGERLFERSAIRVIGTRIIESGRESAVLGALESGREMNRLRDRAGDGVDLAAGMNGNGFWSQSGIGFRHGRTAQTKAVDRFWPADRGDAAICI